MQLSLITSTNHVFSTVFYARGSLEMQDAKVAKNRHLGTIAQLCRAISSQLRHVSTIGKKTCQAAICPQRRRLRSASSNQLDVPSFRLSTVGSRAFPIAGAKVWNSLPDDVTSALSLSIFRRHLKTYLFRCCYNTD